MQDLDTMPMTNLRIFVSLHLGVLYVLFVMVGIIMGRLTDANNGPVQGLGYIISLWMAVDVGHFAFKRFSDRGLAEAKAGAPAPTPITVEAPSTVTVTQPVATTVALKRESEKGTGL